MLRTPREAASTIASTSIPGPEISEARRDLTNAPDSIGPLRVQELRENSTVRIDEVTEHVHVALVLDCSDLDPGNDADAELCPSFGRLRSRRPCRGRSPLIVGQARVGSAMHEIARRQETVRGWCGGGDRSTWNVHADGWLAAGLRAGRLVQDRCGSGAGDR